MSITSHKRIAANTVMLYVRMLLVMGVTLYMSRVVLEALGIEDFGIYNLVAGMTLMFAFFTSALSNSTQRFLNIEHGRDDLDKARKIFNISLRIYLYISLAIFVGGEAVGYWLIMHKLSIPPDRIGAAVWVLHATMLSLMVTFNGIVYQAVLISRENMKVYAYVGVFEAVARLAIAFAIMAVPGDERLVIYAWMLLGVSIITQVFYYLYCRRYEECRFERVWDRKIFVAMFKFTGWNTFGCGVYAVNSQGINILLNIFFGPVVNAARAISAQVEHAVNNFTTNFFTAVRPQMVKSYGAGDIPAFIHLIFFSSKLSYFLCLMLSLPIMFRIDYILHWWLTEVPEYTSGFVVWVLIFSLVNVLTNPLWTAIQAVNRMRGYCLVGGMVFLSAFPISYLWLKLGHGPVAVFEIIAVVRLVYVFVVLYIVQRHVKFTIGEYLRNVIWPIVKVTPVAAALCWGIDSLLPQGFGWLVLAAVMMMGATVLASVGVGLNSQQRSLMYDKIKQTINSKYGKKSTGGVSEKSKGETRPD